jgi:hydrocephalus-inducing protein
MTEVGYLPFSVEPALGKLEPGKTKTFKVKFAPLNANEYVARLMCQIPNSEEDKQGLVLAVKGRGILPYCHFELPESDYISSGRRNPDLPGPNGAAPGLGLDPNTKVIEFSCVGAGSTSTRRFEIVNPTNTDYEYEWTRNEENEVGRVERASGRFICLTSPQGTLASGDRSQVEIEFRSGDMTSAIVESFWRFRIAKLDLAVPFLLLGRVSEPRVLISKSHISLGELLVGHTVERTFELINQESDKRVQYAFDADSCYAEGRADVLLVSPLSGTLEPRSSAIITVRFQAKQPRSSVFNLKCRIANSTKTLYLNVKCDSYRLLTKLFVQDDEEKSGGGGLVELNERLINSLHMGQVEKNESRMKNLYVANACSHRVDYEWSTIVDEQNVDNDENNAHKCFSIEPQRGQIEPGEKQQCLLKYKALYEKLTAVNYRLNIENGSEYNVRVDGVAVQPELRLSFVEHDFGACFVHKTGMTAKTIVLTMSNYGAKEINVSYLKESVDSSSAQQQQQELSCFQLDFKQVILAPSKSATATISFAPAQCRQYVETFTFDLNGLTRRCVTVRGLGCNFRVDPLDVKQRRLLDLGTLQIGGKATSKRTLRLVNRSAATIDLFQLLIEPSKSDNPTPLQSDGKNMLKIEPLSGTRWRPGETLDVHVSFEPRCRVPRFSQQLCVQYDNSVIVPVCTLEGACHGYNIWLDLRTLPFGAIGQRCATTKRVVMYNEGDMGASFRWDISGMQPEYSVQPTMGYISPGMRVYFDVIFTATALSSEIRKENVKLYVEGLDEPLLLTLTGSCAQIAPHKEIIHFETQVRQKQAKQISIVNKTNAAWELKPLVEGEYFSGADSLRVEAQSSATYELVYYPLMMTLLTTSSSLVDAKKQQHTGSVFFALPDGTGLLYSLVGAASAPRAAGKIQREVPCKTEFVESLLVENWLKKPQRFKVIFDIVKQDKTDTSTSIKGYEYIDVAGNGHKEYKLSFYAHKEGLVVFKVIFKNEQTSEYSFYEMTFKAFKGGSMATIDLVTQVRVPKAHSIRLENPLGSLVTFNASCTNQNEILMPNSLTISAKSQVCLTLIFLINFILFYSVLKVIIYLKY